MSRTIDIDSLFEAKNREAVGKSFPKFKAKGDKGEFNSDSLKGKVVLINFGLKVAILVFQNSQH